MTLHYEKKKIREGFNYVIGCDEVGRGCLAGPVVAAAVAVDGELKAESYKVVKSAGIRDSKLLSPMQRVKAAEIIKRHFLCGIGVVDEKIIDKINIHHATLLAMRRAVEDLLSQQILIPDLVEGSKIVPSTSSGNKFYIVIDGKFTIPNFNIAQEAVVDGDNKILSVAAASIIAKVFRDDLMRKYHTKHPLYNFAQHKGYGTLFHRQMIVKHGLSRIHRKSFCNNIEEK